MTSAYSISLIRDAARGTSQLYLRVVWASAFKQFLRGGRLQESNKRALLPRRGPGTSTFWEIISCIQFVSYAVCRPVLLYTANIEIRECVKWSLQEVKTKENHILSGPKTLLVAVAYRRWSFTRGSNSGCNCKALTGKVVVFWTSGRLWELAAYERWSHMEVRL